MDELTLPSGHTVLDHVTSGHVVPGVGMVVTRAPVRLARVKLAPPNATPARSVLGRLAAVRLTELKTAPAISAPARFERTIDEKLKAALSKIGVAYPH